ncbi:PadR family transcriptional regulator [Nonomuraea sp. NPDC000554]|uniref:PadR family transcriptional regulator n=1 Tax=Nonomuraea sp. NPDC000554 TaxID=3154259 RepID=UPI003326025D
MSRPSTLALAVLSMLGEAELKGQAAMHPYKMQQLIKERGKDEVVNVGQRASLYRTIDRLHKAGLVRVLESERQDNRPERTLFALTDEGRRTWRTWMLDALSTPTRHYPEFPAAIAFIPLLEPAEVLEQLEKRRVKLVSELERVETVLAESAQWARLFTLEMEYLRATTAAELGWVESLVGDLRAGSVTWSAEWLAAMASQQPPGGADEEHGQDAAH